VIYYLKLASHLPVSSSDLICSLKTVTDKYPIVFSGIFLNTLIDSGGFCEKVITGLLGTCLLASTNSYRKTLDNDPSVWSENAT